MKKTNQKGFTLVELIVVSTLMVIILGAILNLIEPLNKFYKNVQTTADSTDIGNLTMSYLEDELRYSTEVLVLEDFKGVPLVKDGFIQRTDGTNMYNQYTDCIVVENNPELIRGYINGATGGSGDTTPGRRKGAFGQLYKTQLGTGALDVSKFEIPLGEDVYGDYSYNFTIRGPQSVNTTNQILEVGMQVYKPEHESSVPAVTDDTDIYTVNGYHYNTAKPMFTQQRSLELMNINQIGRKFVLYYFSDSADVSGVSPIPSDIKLDTHAWGGDMAEFSLYSKAVPHTFIFYRKDEDTSSADKVTVRLIETGDSIVLNKNDVIPKKYGKYDSSGSPNLTDSSTWDAASWYKKYSGTTTVHSDGKLYAVGVGTIKDKEHNKELQDWIQGGEQVAHDLNFHITKTEILIAEPLGYVRFWNNAADIGVGKAAHEFPIYDPSNTYGLRKMVTASEYASLESTTTPSRKHEFDHWIDQSTGAPLTGDITTSKDIVAEYKVAPTFYYQFYDTDETTRLPISDKYKDEYFLLSGDSDTAYIPPSEYPDYTPTDPNKVFVGWKEVPHGGVYFGFTHFPKPGEILKEHKWYPGSVDEYIKFVPDLRDKHASYMFGTISGAGELSNVSCKRTVNIYNAGDRLYDEDVVVHVKAQKPFIATTNVEGIPAEDQGFYRHGSVTEYNDWIFVTHITLNPGETAQYNINIDVAEEFEWKNIDIEVSPETDPDTIDESSAPESAPDTSATEPPAPTESDPGTTPPETSAEPGM